MPFVLVGGALFGPVLGTILNLLGATLSALISFLISRYIGIQWLSIQKQKRIHFWVERVEHHSWKSVAISRLTPIPFSFVN